VFERFERIDAPDVVMKSGAGLGLHIVQGLVAALGGKVSLESRVGVGTTVTLRLPLHPEAEPALDGSATAEA
jgi:signal transduction histidine kinase